MPCVNTKTGKVMFPPPPILSEKLMPLASPPPRVDMQQIEAPIRRQGQAFSQRLSNLTHDAPQWTYQGNEAYYHEGDTTQGFDVRTLQSYATSQAQFQESYQLGEGIGKTVGALVRVWVAHHQGGVLERKNLRQQISACYSATFDLMDQQTRERNGLIADYIRLGQLDAAHRSIYEQRATQATASNSRFAALRADEEQMLPRILAEKKDKDLRKSLAVAESVYGVTRSAGEKEYVYSQFMHGLVGYFAYRQMAHATSAVSTAQSRPVGASTVAGSAQQTRAAQMKTPPQAIPKFTNDNIAMWAK